jgi:hypothetical protein
MNLQSLKPSAQSLMMARFAVSCLSPDVAKEYGIALDAQDVTTMFARLFEWIDSETIRGEYQPMEAEELVPFQPCGGPSVETVTYQSVTELGRAEIVSDGTTQIPLVDVVGAEMSKPVRNLTVGWQVSVFDLLRAASNPTIDISTEKKKTAFNAVRRLHEEIAMIGSTKLGWTGLVNDTTIPLVTQAGSGTGWLTATAAEQVADCNKLGWSIAQTSLNLYKGKIFTLLVPLILGQRLDEPMGTNADRTARKYIIENSEHVKEIRFTPFLNTMNAAGTGPRIMMYWKDPSIVRYGQNKQFMELKPQEVDLMIKTPCIGRTSGVHVLRPLGAAYMDVD